MSKRLKGLWDMNPWHLSAKNVNTRAVENHQYVDYLGDNEEMLILNIALIFCTHNSPKGKLHCFLRGRWMVSWYSYFFVIFWQDFSFGAFVCALICLWTNLCTVQICRLEGQNFTGGWNTLLDCTRMCVSATNSLLGRCHWSVHQQWQIVGNSEENQLEWN